MCSSFQSTIITIFVIGLCLIMKTEALGLNFNAYRYGDPELDSADYDSSQSENALSKPLLPNVHEYASLTDKRDDYKEIKGLSQKYYGSLMSKTNDNELTKSLQQKDYTSLMDKGNDRLNKGLLNNDYDDSLMDKHNDQLIKGLLENDYSSENDDELTTLEGDNEKLTSKNNDELNKASLQNDLNFLSLKNAYNNKFIKASSSIKNDMELPSIHHEDELGKTSLQSNYGSLLDKLTKTSLSNDDNNGPKVYNDDQITNSLLPNNYESLRAKYNNEFMQTALKNNYESAMDKQDNKLTKDAEQDDYESEIDKTDDELTKDTLQHFYGSLPDKPWLQALWESTAALKSGLEEGENIMSTTCYPITPSSKQSSNTGDNSKTKTEFTTTTEPTTTTELTTSTELTPSTECMTTESTTTTTTELTTTGSSHGSNGSGGTETSTCPPTTSRLSRAGPSEEKDQQSEEDGQAKNINFKTKDLQQLVQHLYVAQARVQLEATEIKKAQALANSAQQSLEDASNHVRMITSQLQNAQQAVASAAIRAQTAQLQLAAHDQLLFAARQDVDALSSQMVGLQAADSFEGPKYTFDFNSLNERLKQTLQDSQKPTPIPRLSVVQQIVDRLSKEDDDPQQLLNPQETDDLYKYDESRNQLGTNKM